MKPALRTLPEDAVSPDGSLLYMLLLAFLGGAILNLMPCVFPILSLKVLSVARSTDHDRHLHSWVYAAGVIASFVAVAGLLIVLQQAGNAIGWGFQLQSPGFVIALAYLFIAMGLSLSGVVALGGNLMNTGSGLANRGGLTGSFLPGAGGRGRQPLYRALHGDCARLRRRPTAADRPAGFRRTGSGHGAPLLLFGYSGGARALMPKPGAWMETLKQLLAFPLYATAIWLLWVAGRQTGVNTMTAALSGALMLALGLWLWNESPARRVLTVACLLIAVGLGSQHQLDAQGSGAARLAEGQVAWSDAEVTARCATPAKRCLSMSPPIGASPALPMKRRY
ncbi:MAG: hypothetical protein IPG64_11750 [Haliea sp.]|nr:hypothetical protein [Haliea sp.]